MLLNKELSVEVCDATKDK